MHFKIFYRFFIFFIICFLCFLSFSRTQTVSSASYNIKGTIKDSLSGETLVYANLVIKGTTLGTNTNEHGFFVIVGAPHDTVTLIVSYMGYLSKEVIFNNSKGNSDQLLIELKPYALESKEVAVIGENYKIWKSSEEAGQITISPREISALPRVGEADIFRSLQLLPGINGANGGAELSILGGTPDQNLVQLDGMTVYHVNHFFGFFSAFNSDAIKDVQVYKGGYPAKFGGRLSSVIDLSGKTGNVNSFKLDAGVNLLSVNGLLQIPLFQKGSILVSARRSFDGPLYNSIFSFLSGGDNQSPPQGAALIGNFQQETVLPLYYFYDLNSKISYQLSEKDFASVSFYSGDDYLDQTEGQNGSRAIRIGGSAGGNSGGVTKWGNIGSSFRLLRQWNDVLFSNLIFSYSNYNSDNSNSSNFANSGPGQGTFSSGSSSSNSETSEENQINDLTLGIDNQWNISSFDKIDLGGKVSSIKTDYDYSVDDSSIVGLNNKSFLSSFYLQNKLEVAEDLDFTLGLRNSYYNLSKTIYWEPRASFNYEFFGSFKLKGAWGKYHQFINQITHENILQGSRDFWIVSDDKLKPGFSEHYILSLDYETSDYLFSIECYYKTFENLVEFNQRIPLNPRSINYYLANFFTGSGYAKGAEFLFQKKLGAFNWWASYTLSKAEYTFPGFDSNESFPAGQDRTHEIKIAGDYTMGNWVFSGSWNFATGSPYTSPESKYFITLLNGETQSYTHISKKNAYRLPDYQLLDISAAYSFDTDTFKGEIGASIYNLYNHKNIWYRKFDLNSNPIQITDVAMLGFTPTLFLKLNF